MAMRGWGARIMGQPWGPQHGDPDLVQIGGNLGCNDVIATIRIDPR